MQLLVLCKDLAKENEITNSLVSGLIDCEKPVSKIQHKRFRWPTDKWMMGWSLLSFTQRWISVFCYGNGNKRIQNDSEMSRLSGEIGWHSESLFNQERGSLCALPPGWVCQSHVPPWSAAGWGKDKMSRKKWSSDPHIMGLWREKIPFDFLIHHRVLKIGKDH